MRKYSKIFYLLIFLLLFTSLTPSAMENVTTHLNDTRALYKETEEVVQVFNSGNKAVYITKDDIHLMSKIVYAESNGEPYEGKIAVASVILNRVTNPSFPKSIEGVILQKNAFSCVVNGKINAVPDESCYNAVMDALNGKDPTNKAVFFYNPRISTSRWMKSIDKNNIKTIGNHVFFEVSK